MDKIWEIAPRKFDDVIDQLLFNRGIIKDAKEEEKKLKFFKPNFDEDLHDPFLMKNLEKAVLRIKEAKEKGETIGIFADYDADGIPGAALLYKALKQIGIQTHTFIPNREGGYGLSIDGIDYLIRKGCSLIVTVDLGIRNFAETKYCKEKGVGLIITDHHLPADKIPEADLVINPKQEGDKYPFKDLAGCGVAFKLVQGLSKYFKEIDEKFLKWNLDLVAISTISDVVPLIGENRIIAKYGLIVFKKCRNTGLTELMKVARIEPDSITGYTIGFQIGPRINAPGRVDHATKSFELLITEDKEEAKELAAWLDEKNSERQSAMDEVEKEALSKIEKAGLFEDKILIVAGDWQKGVIGPTASRMVEKFHRPVILFAKDEKGFTGSARSISAVHILNLLAKVANFIDKYGGHAGAAGISVSKARFIPFEKALKDIAKMEISDDDLLKKLKVDILLKSPEVSKTMYEKIIKLEPFGLGNPRPTFCLKNISFKDIRFVGKESQHFSARIVIPEQESKAIFFNFPFDKDIIKEENYYDIIFSLSLDEWNNRSKLSLGIIDLKPNEKN